MGSNQRPTRRFIIHGAGVPDAETPAFERGDGGFEEGAEFQPEVFVSADGLADIGALRGGFEGFFADFFVEEFEGAVFHVGWGFEVDCVWGEDEADEDGVCFCGAHGW